MKLSEENPTSTDETGYRRTDEPCYRRTLQQKNKTKHNNKQTTTTTTTTTKNKTKNKKQKLQTNPATDKPSYRRAPLQTNHEFVGGESHGHPAGSPGADLHVDVSGVDDVVTQHVVTRQMPAPFKTVPAIKGSEGAGTAQWLERRTRD